MGTYKRLVTRGTATTSRSSEIFTLSRYQPSAHLAVRALIHYHGNYADHSLSVNHFCLLHSLYPLVHSYQQKFLPIQLQINCAIRSVVIHSDKRDGNCPATTNQVRNPLRLRGTSLILTDAPRFWLSGRLSRPSQIGRFSSLRSISDQYSGC